MYSKRGEPVLRFVLAILDIILTVLTVFFLCKAGRFRRLVGTMTPPDESIEGAEIYVEGSRKMVDGFIRWCQRADIGLSQKLIVEEVIEEEPTGLYEDFYVKTK